MKFFIYLYIHIRQKGIIIKLVFASAESSTFALIYIIIENG